MSYSWDHLKLSNTVLESLLSDSTFKGRFMGKHWPNKLYLSLHAGENEASYLHPSIWENNKISSNSDQNVKHLHKATYSWNTFYLE